MKQKQPLPTFTVDRDVVVGALYDAGLKDSPASLGAIAGSVVETAKTYGLTEFTIEGDVNRIDLIMRFNTELKGLTYRDFNKVVPIGKEFLIRDIVRGLYEHNCEAGFEDVFIRTRKPTKYISGLEIVDYCVRFRYIFDRSQVASRVEPVKVVLN